MCPTALRDGKSRVGILAPLRPVLGAEGRTAPAARGSPDRFGGVLPELGQRDELGGETREAPAALDEGEPVGLAGVVAGTVEELSVQAIDGSQVRFRGGDEA